ncbi:MAG: FAD-dependent oxidoreductase [Nitriliruptorales bacterium]|nr:FAD-dependent oxidoreductase [Nitriliruptorales bacterium]
MALPMDRLSYWDENIPCLKACPVHTNAGAYVAAIADGEDLHAYLTARLPNPFASVCGRVCAAPCEDACRRGEIDEPIAIRALKRFVTEKYGVEAGSSAWKKVAAAKAPDRPERVAIVGGGPAGLSAAHDLRRWGYQVTLYEATKQLGGMMLLGIPEYRLDRDLLAGEIDAIVELGVDVHLDTKLGEDVTLEELRRDNDAVFLAIGATLGRGLDIPGHDSEGVLKAIEFLLNLNQGFHVDVGERVVVVGGGNVAMDAARTALRTDAYEQDRQHAAMTKTLDVARSAKRAGAREVKVVALESREEMPADDFEIVEAQEEGIEFIHRRGPQQILVEDGRTVGLETIGVLSVFDEEGRFSPEFDEEDRSTIEADTVILAIGQAVDLDALGAEGPEVDQRRTIAIEEESLATSLPRVFAGGDAAKGPRNLIDAIADGRRAAAAIHRELTGETEAPTEGREVTIEDFHRFRDPYDRFRRVDIPNLPAERRMGLQQVELGFTEEQARLEASRCLRCFANVQLDVNACVLCALCVDVCPVDVLSMEPSGTTVPEDPLNTALVLDERACIRCAMCIERCPTDALSMSLWTGWGVPA